MTGRATMFRSWQPLVMRLADRHPCSRKHLTRSMHACWTGKHELGTEHDDADESMLWKWEPRDLRTLPKAYAAAGKALKKRLGEVRCCVSLHRAVAHQLSPALAQARIVYTGGPLPEPQVSDDAQANKELKLLAAAHSALSASIKGKGTNKRDADAIERLSKFRKKTADDAPGRVAHSEPASGTARSASSTPTNRQQAPGSQVGCALAIS